MAVLLWNAARLHAKVVAVIFKTRLTSARLVLDERTTDFLTCKNGRKNAAFIG
jgi:hypothetical protein